MDVIHFHKLQELGNGTRNMTKGFSVLLFTLDPYCVIIHSQNNILVDGIDFASTIKILITSEKTV